MGKPDADDPGLPDLPPEWGRIVVPDNASGLEAEAEQVRRELRLSSPTRAAALPLLALLVAMVTTLAGLTAVIWAQSPRSAVSAPTPTTDTPPADLIGQAVPAFDLVDEGQPVPLRGLLPAVIVLADACACPAELTSTAAVAPPGVTVIAVNADPAVRVSPPTAPTTVRTLDDPAGGLRAFLRLPPRTGVVTALLVDHAGTVLKVVPEIRSTADYEPELARLTG